MKGKSIGLFLTILITISSIFISTCADAYYVYYRPYHHRYYHRYYRGGCRWVPAHWSHGYYHPGHRVCWY